jgi:Sulfotransferase domain/N-terminal domain of galactosyltransferase
MTMPRICFATTCTGRLAHLSQTLPRNIVDNRDYDNLVFVVLEYARKDFELENYIRMNHWADIESGRLAYYAHTDGEGFHVALAKNLAARCAILEGADILVTVDADNGTGPGFARFVAEKMSEGGPRFFLCPNHVQIKTIPHGPERPQRGYAGRLAIRTQDFIQMGGYDEIFNTWRGEDIDIIARMRRLDYTMGFIPNNFLQVIPHGANLRFQEYAHAKIFERAYEFRVISSRTETVSNFGHWGCGTVYRNFSPKPIELLPLPTRVFGVGMQRTGTTSLHHAFQTLGLDSWHWNSNRQAWRIFAEMNSLGRSPLLEQFYCLCDNPIPILYQKLDLAYPNSKFILTMLEEETWIRAIKFLWDPNRSPHYDWDRQPFSHRIHEALYGRRDFDREVFLARYRRHNSEVVEYFKSRPQDLLVMPMSELNSQQCWEKLCGFLGKPVPSVPYPHANRERNLENRAWLHAGDL